MTRLNIAFVVPAGFLGCLTMSAALVVGHAEISQLRPHERRTVQAVETAVSPFRVIAGVRMPDLAPPLTSVPSPSAAAAPAAAPHAPGLGVPDEALLPPAEIPSEVPEPSWVRRRADRVVAMSPEPARGGLGMVVAEAFDAVHLVLDVTEYERRKDEAHAVVDPVYEAAVSPTRPARHQATAEAQGKLDAARS